LAGGLLAVADKADNIVGAWAGGEKPSGSRDPYGLRRAAMGIVRIALEFALRFGVEDLLSAALAAYDDQGVTHSEGIVAEATAFVWERLQVLLLDEGLPFPMVEAALASSAADVPARAARARSFAALDGRDFFDDVVTVYSRCASLAEKASGEAPPPVDQTLFSEPAEGGLHEALAAAAGPVADALAHLEISSALVAAAKLRPAVDRYFDDVLVMDPDPAVRANRLAQLRAVVGLLRRLGDFGRLPVPALKASDANTGATT
jgi:glycyl-tRNA synthetase beta chain